MSTNNSHSEDQTRHDKDFIHIVIEGLMDEMIDVAYAEYYNANTNDVEEFKDEKLTNNEISKVCYYLAGLIIIEAAILFFKLFPKIIKKSIFIIH